MIVPKGVAPDIIPLTSFSAPIDLYALYGRRVQGLTIAAKTDTPTITIRTAESGTTNRVLTVTNVTYIACEAWSIQAVSSVTEMWVHLAALP